MSDPESSIASVQTLPRSRATPLGGSKWARFYGRQAPVSFVEPRVTVHQDAVIREDGRVSGGDDFPDPVLDAEHDSVFALEAGETVSLGQFLTGSLNIALQSAAARFLAGPVLTPRQTDVLGRLGRLRDFVSLTEPTGFKQVTAATFSPQAAPPAAIRQVADRLRAVASGPGGAIAILPVRHFERFGLVNRTSLTAWLRAKRFTVIEPERLKLAELIEVFAAAPMVLLADPRQAGLLGLCHPGTKILEIAPEGWLSGEAGHFSQVFGLVWQPFLAAPPSYPLRGALPFGSLVPCSYEIPIRELALALQTFIDS